MPCAQDGGCLEAGHRRSGSSGGNSGELSAVFGEQKVVSSARTTACAVAPSLVDPRVRRKLPAHLRHHVEAAPQTADIGVSELELGNYRQLTQPMLPAEAALEEEQVGEMEPLRGSAGSWADEADFSDSRRLMWSASQRLNRC